MIEMNNIYPWCTFIQTIRQTPTSIPSASSWRQESSTHLCSVCVVITCFFFPLQNLQYVILLSSMYQFKDVGTGSKFAFFVLKSEIITMQTRLLKKIKQRGISFGFRERDTVKSPAHTLDTDIVGLCGSAGEHNLLGIRPDQRRNLQKDQPWSMRCVSRQTL